MIKQFDTIIIVLGSPNDDTGELSTIAKSRCKKAYELYQELVAKGSCAVLATGGFGEHFNRTDTAHANYTKQYMIDLGIPKESFLEIAMSSHTIEDAMFSYEILKQYEADKCFVVTSDFHADRVRFIFEDVYTRLNTKLNSQHKNKMQELIVVPAITDLDKEALDKVIVHEKQALAGLKKNGIIYEGL